MHRANAVLLKKDILSLSNVSQKQPRIRSRKMEGPLLNKIFPRAFSFIKPITKFEGSTSTTLQELQLRQTSSVNS